MEIWSAEIKELQKLYESFRGQLPDLEKELERLINADDENMLLLYSRRCLEVIITDLCECELKRPRKTEPLKGIIDKLLKEEKVPAHIITSMHGLNDLSNYGAHPKTFVPEQLKPVLVNLNIIIKWYLRWKETTGATGPGTDQEKPFSTGTRPVTEIKKISRPAALNKQAIIARSVILAGLIILGFLLIPKLFASKEEPEKSIVVLPFKNHTGNPDQDYLVQGQNDAMVSELCMISQVRQLRILSGRTAAVIAGSSRPIPEIADEIDVDYIIEGSVLNVSDSIKLQLRLIQAYPDEKLIWTRLYSSDLGNIFKLHHNIANEIAGKIGIDLTPENLAALASPQTINPETYKLYVRGMYSLRLETPESILKGFDYLNQAINLDPADAFAHAALASGYFEIAHGPLDPGDAMIKGEAAALQAIKLDTTLAETYFALAQAYEYSLWKFREAEKYFKKAISLNPNNAYAHYHYAWALVLFGRNKEALAEHLQARKYDPFAPEIAAQLGWLYLHTGQKEKALQEALKSLDLRPDYNQGLWGLGDVYLAMGKVEAAIATHKKLAEKYPAFIFKLGVTYAKAGKESEAAEILKRMNTLKPNPFIALGFVMLNSALNNKDEAFKWLSYEPHHIWLPWVAVMDWGSNLHDDPRFDEFLKKLNLPEK